MRPCVATIGFFDGVHRGHRFLIERLKEDAAREGLESTVITFERHPRQVLSADYQPKLLTTFEEKVLLLSKTGVDNCAVLQFDQQMAQLTAREFMERVLSGLLNVKKLYIGYDHRFGHNREEGFEDYVRYGEELGIEVVQNSAFDVSGVNVSSSVIRSFLQEGEVEMAARCLGYPYFLIGKVTTGVQEGRKLGFPTANIAPWKRKALPKYGVYACVLETGGEILPSVANVGVQPTLPSGHVTVEAHILTECPDLYGRKACLTLLSMLREEKKFDSPEELKAQIAKDRDEALKRFGMA